MYAVSVMGTVLGLTALSLLRRFEHKDDDVLRRKISLVLGGDAPSLSAIFSALDKSGAVISPAEYEKQIDAKLVHVTFPARFPADRSDQLVALLESQPGVRRVRVEPMG
jgi:putative Mg2+ transporter-C (MgtC) family protein